MLAALFAISALLVPQEVVSLGKSGAWELSKQGSQCRAAVGYGTSVDARVFAVIAEGDVLALLFWAPGWEFNNGDVVPVRLGWLGSTRVTNVLSAVAHKTSEGHVTLRISFSGELATAIEEHLAGSEGVQIAQYRRDLGLFQFTGAREAISQTRRCGRSS